MKTEKEILLRIKTTTESYAHVLNQPCMNIGINAPGALMQLQATSQLQILYWTLEKEMPNYICSGGKKKV